MPNLLFVHTSGVPNFLLLYHHPGVFRECGGARCAHNMVPYKVCRSQVLNIVQQLVLCNGGDDDMGTLLGLMHTTQTTALELKMHILKVRGVDLKFRSNGI